MTTETRTPATGTGTPATADRPGERRTARLQRRRSTYRGEEGTLISGRDTRDRFVRVFVHDGGELAADDVLANVRAGRRPFEREEGASSPDQDQGEEHTAPTHRDGTLSTVTTENDRPQAHTEKPEAPVLIPQRESTGGRKPYNVRLRMSLVAEAMDMPTSEGMSLAELIEQLLEGHIAQA